MNTPRRRLIALMQSILPFAEPLPDDASELSLHQLGFDSMALVSLFVGIEEELGVPLEDMASCLVRHCTFGALEALCTSAT